MQQDPNRNIGEHLGIQIKIHRSAYGIKTNITKRTRLKPGTRFTRKTRASRNAYALLSVTISGSNSIATNIYEQYTLFRSPEPLQITQEHSGDRIRKAKQAPLGYTPSDPTLSSQRIQGSHTPS